jgi:hypothetical protein
MRKAPAAGALEAHEGLDSYERLSCGDWSSESSRPSPRSPSLGGGPFRLVVDWLAASIIAIEIVAGVQFHN